MPTLLERVCHGCGCARNAGPSFEADQYNCQQIVSKSLLNGADVVKSWILKKVGTGVPKALSYSRSIRFVGQWQPEIDHVGYDTLNIIYVRISVCVQRNPRMWRIPWYSSEKVT